MTKRYASLPLFKITSSWRKDPVLRRNKTTGRNTEVELVVFRWTYDHIENKEGLTAVLLSFFKKFKNFSI
jgi:hypothetical protein